MAKGGYLRAWQNYETNSAGQIVSTKNGRIAKLSAAEIEDYNRWLYFNKASSIEDERDIALSNQLAYENTNEGQTKTMLEAELGGKDLYYDKRYWQDMNKLGIVQIGAAYVIQETNQQGEDWQIMSMPLWLRNGLWTNWQHTYRRTDLKTRRKFKLRQTPIVQEYEATEPPIWGLRAYTKIGTRQECADSLLGRNEALLPIDFRILNTKYAQTKLATRVNPRTGETITYEKPTWGSKLEYEKKEWLIEHETDIY